MTKKSGAKGEVVSEWLGASPVRVSCSRKKESVERDVVEIFKVDNYSQCVRIPVTFNPVRDRRNTGGAFHRFLRAPNYPANGKGSVLCRGGHTKGDERRIIRARCKVVCARTSFARAHVVVVVSWMEVRWSGSERTICRESEKKEYSLEEGECEEGKDPIFRIGDGKGRSTFLVRREVWILSFLSSSRYTRIFPV